LEESLRLLFARRRRISSFKGGSSQRGGGLVGEMDLKKLKRKIEASDVGAAVKAVEGW
jgi:hypothetical protein